MWEDGRGDLFSSKLYLPGTEGRKASGRSEGGREAGLSKGWHHPGSLQLEPCLLAGNALNLLPQQIQGEGNRVTTSRERQKIGERDRGWKGDPGPAVLRSSCTDLGRIRPPGRGAHHAVPLSEGFAAAPHPHR